MKTHCAQQIPAACNIVTKSINGEQAWCHPAHQLSSVSRLDFRVKFRWWRQCSNHKKYNRNSNTTGYWGSDGKTIANLAEVWLWARHKNLGIFLMTDFSNGRTRYILVPVSECCAQPMLCSGNRNFWIQQDWLKRMVMETKKLLDEIMACLT